MKYLKPMKFLSVCGILSTFGINHVCSAEELIRVTQLPRTSCGFHFQNFTENIQICEGKDPFYKVYDFKVILTPYSWQDVYIEFQFHGGISTTSDITCTDKETNTITFKKNRSLECSSKL